MNSLIKRPFFDKLILFSLIGLTFFMNNYQNEMIVFMLIPIALSLFILVSKEPKVSSICLFILLLLANWWVEYSYFASILFYDGTSEKKEIELINSGLLLIFLFSNNELSIEMKIYMVLLCFFAYYLAMTTMNKRKLTETCQLLEMKIQENRFSLESKNTELVKQQETAIQLELSNERNRIARDIHDNVGHLLSSSLLQIGALRTINQAEMLEMPLLQLQETITEGMNSIRESVHDLHDESLSLTLACQNILKNFDFCDVEIKHAFSEQLNKEYKLAFIMLIKEGLANVMKHSNADKVTIDFQNHPAFYKLTFLDNGTKQKEKSLDELGIGLVGMQERMEKLGGRLNYHQTVKGFSIIAILPK